MSATASIKTPETIAYKDLNDLIRIVEERVRTNNDKGLYSLMLTIIKMQQAQMVSQSTEIAKVEMYNEDKFAPIILTQIT